jgi:hypothetical protein
MPSCPSCHQHTSPDGLAEVGEHLACTECRRLKLVPDTTEAKHVSHPDLQGPAKSIVNVSVTEFALDKGGVDHRISVTASLGAASFNFGATFDQIREFFTKRKSAATK